MFSPGQTLGSYRIIRLIGQGGTGAVYEVEHVGLGVHYALKAFTCEKGHVDVLRKKFLAEGKVLARLNTPRLVRVFDLAVDEPTDVPYFVMDLVTGKDGAPHTLADVEAADLDELAVYMWFEDLCEALDYVHSQGIVHRDIKRGNVLLREDRHAVLSDFGISRIFGEKLTGEINVTRTMVSDATTAARLVMGTVGYMAPEVLRGREATPAADVYSLGVMFVHLLTGIWYEPGSKALDLLDGFSYQWKGVLSRMLEVDPEKRPRSLAELPRQVRPETARANAVGRIMSFFSGRTSLLVAAAVCAVLLGIVFAFCLPSRGIGPASLSEDDDFREIFSADGIFSFPKAPQTPPISQTPSR